MASDETKQYTARRSKHQYCAQRPTNPMTSKKNEMKRKIRHKNNALLIISWKKAKKKPATNMANLLLWPLQTVQSATIFTAIQLLALIYSNLLNEPIFLSVVNCAIQRICNLIFSVLSSLLAQPEGNFENTYTNNKKPRRTTLECFFRKIRTCLQQFQRPSLGWQQKQHHLRIQIYT